MRIILIIIFLIVVCPFVYGQVSTGQLEEIMQNNDTEIEDDAYLQQMIQFRKHPVNINSADDALLEELHALSPFQIRQFIAYRVLLGKLISVYELQAVPGWDVQTIQKIRPYISISNDREFTGLAAKLKKGGHSILLRISEVFERPEGYKDPAAVNFYRGSPQKLLIRYKYAYKDLLQYGITGEKDAGEEFFKGSQKQGFDFYSAHFFLHNPGMIRTLALGDYTVNMGQGLIQWQGLAFKKGTDITGIKRQSAVLRPYNSAGEVNFHRGAGITIAKNKWQATVFGSLKKIDANFVTDTLHGDFVSSLQTSGYHRTESEIADKNVQRQIAFGGNIQYAFHQLHIGVNVIQFRFSYPLITSKLYTVGGKTIGNYSMDYRYTYRNMHLFGEAAIGNKNEFAFINGLLISTAGNTDLAFLYRHIAQGYQSLYTNAFTESVSPTNEQGLFSGISLRPVPGWQIDAYADLYKFPGIKFRTDAPASGSDYVLQLTYRPSKQLELYSRYKTESKPINFNPGHLAMNPVADQLKHSWRIHVNYKISPQITLRDRTEIIWFNIKKVQEQGFLMYADLLFAPLLKPYSGNIRLQYFETTGYDSRLYAYENDLLYSYSVPVFYDKGYRYYFNVHYNINRLLSIWAKWSQTISPGKDHSGSGSDEIKGRRRSEIKFQAICEF